MQIIPVIDLKEGLVVHAKQGRREHYAPIQSPLCQSADLEKVIAAYLRLHRFKTFYIADLNAITGNHDHQALLNHLLTNYTELTFWIDSGYQNAPGFYHQYRNYLPVLGSESYTSANYSDLLTFQKKYILSLDFSDTQPLGAKQIFTSTALWPEHIIIMTLHRVGSNQGPDFEKLQQFSGYNVIAAGGIRGVEDLVQLKQKGVKSALLASALHSGAIGTQDLQKIEAL
jgi:phosphoribosylformimino-5-aminoimidazole carboxamide ribotide isomerase